MRPLKNDFVAAKRSFALDDNKADLDALHLQKYGFFSSFQNIGQGFILAKILGGEL